MDLNVILKMFQHYVFFLPILGGPADGCNDKQDYLLLKLNQIHFLIMLKYVNLRIWKKRP